jgi:hypothetical protein
MPVVKREQELHKSWWEPTGHYRSKKQKHLSTLVKICISWWEQIRVGGQRGQEMHKSCMKVHSRENLNQLKRVEGAWELMRLKRKQDLQHTSLVWPGLTLDKIWSSWRLIEVDEIDRVRANTRQHKAFINSRPCLTGLNNSCQIWSTWKLMNVHEVDRVRGPAQGFYRLSSLFDEA